MGRWATTHKAKDRTLRILSTAGLINRFNQDDSTGVYFERAVRCYDVLIEILEDAATAKELSDISGIGVARVKETAETIINNLLFNKEGDPFLSLGLHENTVQERLNKRWKRVLKLYHPDRFFNQKEYEEKAKKINEVYNEATGLLSRRLSLNRAPAAKTQAYDFSKILNETMKAHGTFSNKYYKYSRYIPAFITIVTFSVAVVFTVVFYVNQTSTRSSVNEDKHDTVRKETVNSVVMEEKLQSGKSTAKPSGETTLSASGNDEQSRQPVLKKDRHRRTDVRVSHTKDKEEALAGDNGKPINDTVAELRKDNTPEKPSPASLPGANNSKADIEGVGGNGIHDIVPHVQENNPVGSSPQDGGIIETGSRTPEEGERTVPVQPSVSRSLPGTLRDESAGEVRVQVTTKKNPGDSTYVSKAAGETLHNYRDKDRQELPEGQGDSIIGRTRKPAGTKTRRTSVVEEAVHKDMLSKEDISGFLKRYVFLYEEGDLDAFLGLFGRDAVENGRSVSLLTDRYRKIFRNSKNRYLLSDLSINIKDNNVADVTATFRIVRVRLKDGRNLQYRGRIRWTIKRVANSLKIVRLQYD
ncbi:DnaJ domain protein [bacterium BMS3Bbin06]|nr:DnaJ domain protein [bacterium BMS3Bbin06]